MRWKISNKLEDYNSSIKLMETEVLNIAKNGYDDLTWILEYPPLYTSGLSAKKDDLLNENNIPNGKKTMRNGNDILKITVIKLESPNRRKLYKNSDIPCSSI